MLKDMEGQGHGGQAPVTRGGVGHHVTGTGRIR